MALLTAAASMIAPACSDDNGYYITPSEDTDGFVLMLPSITTFDTRADEYGATAEELKYSSLTFFAFPVEGGEVKTVKLIKNESESGDLNLKDNYTSYPIELKPGKYRFYLTANYFGTTSISSLPQTEEALKAEKIVYENSFTGTIPEKGLPMSCDHSGFHSESGIGLGESFEVTGNENQTVYADLTFACAKVSVTANDMQGATALISSLGVSNISANVPIIKNDNFVNDQTGYGKIDAITVKENATADEAPATLSFYIPERIVSTENKDQQSSATVMIGEKKITLPLGEPSNVSTTETNPLPSADTHRAIKRGTHYIYTLNAKAEPTLKVEPWSVEKILYNIQGQYFLHVEKTAYPIETGKTTAIWYDSNTTPELESPKYIVNSEEVPLYISTVDNDSIYVSVNPAIPTSEYNNIKNSTNGEYDFFHIKAGNIHKRITVTPLNLINYLNVSPLNISIDVRELIASGKYGGYFPILINTNLPKVKIERGSEWNDLPSEEWGQSASEYVIKLTNDDDEQLTVGQDGHIEDMEASKTELRLTYNGINSGKKTWQESCRLTFTVTALDALGNSVTVETDGITKTLSETVTINIIPNIQNYKIHFKAEGWTNPHIYVYQCLEFPSDVENKTLANKPIATDESCNHSALEYSFTGKIAFKGWDTESSYNNPDATAKGPIKGFYYFDPAVNIGSWDADKSGFTNHYYDNMDFCFDYRYSNDCDCEKCKGNSYNKLWPGIKMKKGSGASEGWWDFELTGVAEPGKALIMFADGHTYGDFSLRFPDDDNVGVPLFDFPDKEGWLYYNGVVDDRVNNVFVNNKPQLVTYRIYWSKDPSDSSNFRDHIQFNDGKGGYSDRHQYSGWEIINGQERFYTDLTLFSSSVIRYIAACKSDGSNSYPQNWKKIPDEATAVSGQTYDYYLILY